MQREYFTISNCVFNFNFLALVLSDLLGGPKFTLGVPALAGGPKRNALSIIGFALKGPPQMDFFGGGAKIFGGNPPRNATTADLRRLVKKIVEML